MDNFTEANQPAVDHRQVDDMAARNLKLEMDQRALPRTTAECLRDEAALFSNMPARALSRAAQEITENPQHVMQQVLTGAAIGATLAVAVKNPGVMGKALSHGIMDVADRSSLIFGGMMAADWTYRIGAPMADVMSDHKNLARAQAKLADNVGTGIVDYTAGMVGGLAGAKLAWKFTPEWANVSPIFDRVPSQTLGQKPRDLESGSASMYKTAQEKTVADDVVNLYEKSFPLEERQPVPEVKELVDSGRIVVHTTRDAEGNLQGFSFTSMHDETATKFANLDFIATREEGRSKGLGSLHFSRLRELIGKEHPELSALTLEMEHPKEVGIADDVRALRNYRSKFYDRLDTPDTNIKFTILDFEDPAYRGPAQWRAWVYKPEQFDAVKTARTMYMDEGGYGLPSRYAAPVREFDRANNYWEAPFGAGQTGIYSGITSGTLDSLLNRRK